MTISKHANLEPLKKCSHGIQPDWRIRELANAGMITPFVDGQVKEVPNRYAIHTGYVENTGEPLTVTSVGPHVAKMRSVISYGLSSFGYDMRIADEFKIFTPATGQLTVIDPKDMDRQAMVDYKGAVCIIPPNSFALGRSVEYFRIPRNMLVLCLGKSTYARIGVICNFTPFEPEWEGHVTIEISNTTPLPCKIYANEGIAQALFFVGEEPEVSYADRKGKYQAQTGITLAKV